MVTQWTVLVHLNRMEFGKFLRGEECRAELRRSDASFASVVVGWDYFKQLSETQDYAILGKRSGSPGKPPSAEEPSKGTIEISDAGKQENRWEV